MKIKDEIPFDIDLLKEDYIQQIKKLSSPKELKVRTVSHSFANNFVLHHHYLHRKLYVARNVSYGLFSSTYCVGVCTFGYPVWREYPGLVPPLKPAECPELTRLCTMDNLPKNTESFFVGKCLRNMKVDWFNETGTKPVCITSLCDNALGFNGAIYKATNFRFYRKTKGRPSNPGGSHGKWKKNSDTHTAEKTMFVYTY